MPRFPHSNKPAVLQDPVWPQRRPPTATAVLAALSTRQLEPGGRPSPPLESRNASDSRGSQPPNDTAVVFLTSSKTSARSLPLAPPY